MARRSDGSRALTAPCVATGMNAGVGSSPCGVRSVPARASPSTACRRKGGVDMAWIVAQPAPRCNARRRGTDQTPIADWPDLRRQPPVRFERKTWNLGFWLCHCSMSRIRVDARNSTSEYASLRFDLSNSPLTSLALLLPKAPLNPIDSASTKSVPTHISRGSYLALCKSAMAFSRTSEARFWLLRVVLDSLYELAGIGLKGPGVYPTGVRKPHKPQVQSCSDGVQAQITNWHAISINDSRIVLQDSQASLHSLALVQPALELGSTPASSSSRDIRHCDILTSARDSLYSVKVRVDYS